MGLGGYHGNDTQRDKILNRDGDVIGGARHIGVIISAGTTCQYKNHYKYDDKA
jgi:hypothetical protein